MITKKLFDEIQKALVDNGKPRERNEKKEFLFLNFAKCGECGYSITADRKVKKSGKEYVYYYCTRKSKTYECSQKLFLREENFASQIKNKIKKVSLSDDWKKRYLCKIKEWERENHQSSNLFVQNLVKDISVIKAKLERLTDAYLAEALELSEFQQTKNALMTEKKTKEEKLSDFERKSNQWLELTRNWVLEANQAKNIAHSSDFSSMKNFLKKIGSNHSLAERILEISFSKP